MNENERKDRIVVAAERQDAALRGMVGLYSGDSGYGAALSELHAANREIAEACQPIEPPCKFLLSDEKLERVWAAKHFLKPVELMRSVGADTLEAVGRRLREEGKFDGYAEECLTDIAKKERGI